MIPLSAEKIAEILGCPAPAVSAKITAVSTDSRQTGPDTLFIALKGEKFDGHDFIADVLRQKTPLVLAEHPVPQTDPTRVLIVPDTLKAFGLLAQYNRRQYKGTLIALTGSSGKTTTKEELKAALSAYAPTYATSGNFNNFIGVPRSLLDIDMNAPYAIIEMGMSARGEIDYLTRLAEPDMALITNVYPMHLEFLKTIENIAQAKAEIFNGLKKGGIAVYNEDTACAEILRTAAENSAAAQCLPFGQNRHPQIPLSLSEDGLPFRYNAWAVLTVIQALGLDLTAAVTAVNNFSSPEGRGKKYQLNLNGKQILLIDNSYSGGPDATVMAIDSLGALPVAGRKIALIGKMAELGDYTKEAHIRVGQALRRNHIDLVIGVCAETKDLLNELPAKTERYYFPDIRGVSEFLTANLLKDGDAVLIKGSHYSSQVYKTADELKKFAVSPKEAG